jgi:signal transduction histidine kinase
MPSVGRDHRDIYDRIDEHSGPGRTRRRPWWWPPDGWSRCDSCTSVPTQEGVTRVEDRPYRAEVKDAAVKDAAVKDAAATEADATGSGAERGGGQNNGGEQGRRRQGDGERTGQRSPRGDARRSGFERYASFWDSWRDRDEVDGGYPEGEYPYWRSYWRSAMRHRRHWLGRHHGPFRRSRDARLLGGVAEGLSKRTGIDVTIIRVALVLFGLASGMGFAAYVLAWLFLPVEGESTNIAQRAIEDRRGMALALAFLPALVATLILGAALRAAWVDSLAWPLFVGAAGLVLIWRNAPLEERAVLERLARPVLNVAVPEGRSWRRISVRALLGASLLAGGLVALLLGHPSHILFRSLGGILLVTAAFVVIFGPWWLGVARDLVVERQARALAEERANVATRVHDSVLQTLALIQRRADDPHQVAQLARAQERELRSWLFNGSVPGSTSSEDTTVGEAVQRIQRDVEAAHGIEVEVVTVGDCELDDDLRELLAAAREATVNSAKWSEAPVVSLFAEVEPDEVSVFVRDRGKGFDPGSVPSDRKGVSEAVFGRMTRHGGSADVRSAPGEGTDVGLKMPRNPGRKVKRAAS